jgi:hypothetical protein
LFTLAYFIIKESLNNDWSQLESYLDKKLEYYRECFESKAYNLSDYFIIDESEPYIIKRFLKKQAGPAYTITRSDLISIAKSSMSELTFYYILARLDFEDRANWPLLAPNDDTYGNFVEILFCRLVKGLNSNHEQEIRLRRLLFDMIVLRNAKMTCSLNMLALFLTRNQFTKQRLVEFYFPVLFYMSNSFNVFHCQLYKDRFDSLVSWLFNSTIKYDVFSESSLKLQASLGEVDIEFVLYQYYSSSFNSMFVEENKGVSKASSHEESVETTATEQQRKKNFKASLNLKELARNQFVRAYAKNGNIYEDKILNLVSESTRRFIFHFNDMKNLF